MSDGQRHAARERSPATYAAGVVLVLLCAILLCLGDSLRQPEVRLAGFDLYQRLYPRRGEAQPAIVVAVDDASAQRYGQWPWPRDKIARLIDRIAEQFPAAIGVDAVFAEPDRLSSHALAKRLRSNDPALAAALDALDDPDDALARALSHAPAALAIFGRSDGTAPAAPTTRRPRFILSGGDLPKTLASYPTADASYQPIDAAAAGHGFVNAFDSGDGVVRQVPLVALVEGMPAPALALEMMRIAVGAASIKAVVDGDGIAAVGVPAFQYPTQPDGSVWLHYGPHNPERFVSAWAVLEGAVPADLFTDRLVIIGVTALGLVDTRSTPLGGLMLGPEIHAQVLEQMVEDSFLYRPGWALPAEIAAFSLLGLMLSLAAAGAGIGLSLAALALALFLLAASGLGAFAQADLLLDVLSPAAALLVVYAGTIAVALVESRRHRLVLDSALRREQLAAARVSGELAAARDIQRGMLPPDSAPNDGDPRYRLRAYLEPAREVGGDFYDHLMVDDRHLFFVIGDVSGKGVAASLFMALSMTLARSVAGRATADLGAMMTEANEAIVLVNTETMFVTACAGLLDLDTGHLLVCNAGHETPLLLAPDAPHQPIEAPVLPPLGIMEGLDYTAVHLDLAAGCTVLLVTDGVTEAQDQAGALFGRDRLDALAAGLRADGTDPEAVVAAIRTATDAFQAGAAPADDITVLAVRWEGPRQPGAGAVPSNA